MERGERFPFENLLDGLISIEKVYLFKNRERFMANANGREWINFSEPFSLLRKFIRCRKDMVMKWERWWEIQHVEKEGKKVESN